MNRREFTSTCIGASAALLIPSPLYPKPTIGDWIVRAGKAAARRSPYVVAGIILTEVALGAGRAYGIDIAGEVEERLRRPGSRDWTERSRSGSYRVSEISGDGYLTQRGRCPAGGACRVSASGFELSRSYDLKPIITPGLSLWAALRDSTEKNACLHEQPCGYPKGLMLSQNMPDDKKMLLQPFERGHTCLEVPSEAFTFEAIYEHNLDRAVWSSEPMP